MIQYTEFLRVDLQSNYYFFYRRLRETQIVVRSLEVQAHQIGWMNKSAYSVQVYIATERSTLLTWTLAAYKHMFIQNCRLLTVLQIHVSFTWEKFFFLNDVYSICPSFGSQFSESVHVFWNLFINKRCTVLGLHVCLDKQIVSLLCSRVPRWHICCVTLHRRVVLKP